MDPNWFYSTLAQSTAAIVGLAGGFFVQRLLAQRSELAADRELLRERFQSVMKNVTELRSRVLAVVGAMDRGLEEIEKLKDEGREDFTLHTAYFFTLSHSRSYGGGMVPTAAVSEAEEPIRDTRDAMLELTDVLPTTPEGLFEMLDRSGRLEVGSHRWLEEEQEDRSPGGIEPGTFWEWLPHQRFLAAAAYDGVQKSADSLGHEIAVFRTRLVPATFYALLAILAGLLVAGVITPLFFLSADDGVSKPVLIALFIPLSLGFLAYVGYELLKLRGAIRLTREKF
jgi:hypothetical protein